MKKIVLHSLNVLGVLFTIGVFWLIWWLWWNGWLGLAFGIIIPIFFIFGILTAVKDHFQNKGYQKGYADAEEHHRDRL